MIERISVSGDRRFARAGSAAAWLLVLGISVAGAQDLRNEPYGLPLPPGAVEVSVEEFQAMLQSGRARQLGPTQRAADAAAAQARADETEAILKGYLRRHPEREPDVNGPATDPGSVLVPGGGYDVSFVNRSGNVYTYRAGGVEMGRQMVALGIRDQPDPENQRRIFRAIRRRLPVVWRTRVDRVAGGFSAKNRWLARRWPRIIEDLPPVTYRPRPPLIRDCVGEIGAGAYAGDMDGLSSPPAYDDHGLFAHMTWPNKNNLTCVRDQGSRGTCGAFAIAGVLETAVAQKTRAESNGVAQFLNLSEQWIYGIYRQSFYPQDFDEGRAMPDSKLVFQALANPNITIPFEIGWEYNKSKSREEFGEPPNGFYEDSCVGYSGKPVDGQGPWCSETTHQTRLIYTKVVTQYGLETFAAYALPVVPPGGARIASIGLNLWNDASRDTSLGLAILMLRQGYPMQGGWRGQTSTKKTIVVPTAPGIWEEFPGYVPFPLEDFAPVPALGENFVTPSPGGGDPDEKTDGGHNFHLAGFISNAELRAAVQANPEFVPLLGDQGDYGERRQDLGGWFIIRNSMGRDAGDRGFYYIPVGWAYKNFGGTNAITSAEEVLP